MRLALNASILRAPRTGIGHYVVELVRALALEPELKISLFNGWAWQPDLPAAAMPGYSQASRLIKRWVPNAYALRRTIEQLRFSNGSRHADLYHDPSLWPFDFDGPMVMTLHDLTHAHYPETQPADRLAEIERHVARSIERAQHILVDSEFIAREAISYYGIPSERLTVAPLGCAPRFHPRSESQLRQALQSLALMPREYLLVVGTLEPRKNLQLALEAYAQLPTATREHFPLVIAGMPGWRPEQLAAPLRKALTSGQVRVLGYLDDDTIATLMAGARLLVFPSRYEGFGLPVLEAMSSGTPVLTTRLSAMPEVAGDAGSYFEADDASSCHAGMQLLLEDQTYWEGQQQAGLIRAQAFSWKRCAQITANVYRKAVQS